MTDSSSSSSLSTEVDVLPNEQPRNYPKRRSRLTKTLPTDRIAFAKQLEVINALPVAQSKIDAPFSFKEVADLIGMSESTIAQMSAFLGDVGLVQRVDGGRFTICSELNDFERVRGFSPEKAWLKLKPLFERSWFGQELLPRLRLRDVTVDEAVEALAEACSADNSHKDQLTLATVFLEKAGLVVKEGNMLRLANVCGEKGEEEVVAQAPPPPPKPEDIEIEGLEKHSLTLNPKIGRKVIIFAPPTLSPKELERLQAWLGFQFIIEEDSEK